ncbi:regulator of chromosome condensation 1/beta-lactamase-inhibitor protein II [Phaeosphaeria sp. MPI-PUGE-AT-0046c]|nr:regulator of chromosome condensation 1/beta-lactamase-inhibitor protein II [Phaeosphaeria sp. MPI-PUGE-AT-0046c]
MADKKTSITDLPLDILVLIFPYLPASSFLALCSTCQAFQQPSIRLDPAYWSWATRSTFRIPNQPVVQHDGVRWQKMYRRLFTQSRVYTWGNNSHSRLGHSYDEHVHNNPTMPRIIRPGRVRMRLNTHCAFPTEMEDTRSLGVIADMQCGGWSTTLLTAKGSLHTVGVLDGGRIFAATERLQLLQFPPGYPSSSSEAQYSEPAIAIRQFSAGRAHILAVSDSGRIWSWYHVKNPALQVKFANIDLKEISLTNNSGKSSAYGKVRQVVAGWSQSSAYIQGVGIIIWDPVERDHDEETTDTMLVMATAEVPNTGYQRHKDTRGESDEERALGEAVGAVLNYIILERYVVFVTDIGKVFCAKLGEKNAAENILELRALRNNTDTPLDVQGSFRRFAIFKNNEVVISDQGYLDACWNDQRNNPEQINIPGLKKIPALQNNDVISVSFGDYHYLALHSNGKITSYGTELQACGALGLGSEPDEIGHARGIVYDRFNRDGRLLPHAYTHGRQVWFDGKKKEWIDHLWRGGSDPEEAKERIQLCRTSPDAQGELSEWLEQESRARDDKNTGEDDLGAYFALRVSAAGWHSGALVLVNDELAGPGASKSVVDERFPRLRLADGTDMPGTKDFDEWREGRPEWNLDVQA